MAMTPLVIFHGGGCRDGFCAAWVVRKRYPEADFHPGFYGQPPPAVKDRDIIIVDFSYPLEVMNTIARDCRTLLVLDHHKTAQAALTDLANSGLDHVGINFDMNRSGAGMAWDFYFEKQPRPWIVNYIEDRDLWRFALPNSKSVNAYLGVVPLTFDRYDNLLGNSPEMVAGLGASVVEKTQQYCREVTKNTRWLHWEGHAVPVVNAPQVDISELLDHVINHAPAKPEFAVGWFLRGDGTFQYSLRSRGEFDVSAIAKKYGGGGHKNAAGFESHRLIFDNHVMLMPATEAQLNPTVATMLQEALK